MEVKPYRATPRIADSLPTAHVRLQIQPTITLKEAQLALAQIARRNGCENCGFSGIHIHFEQVINIAHEMRSENILAATVHGIADKAPNGIIVVDG